jgi:hypothetical protein
LAALRTFVPPIKIKRLASVTPLTINAELDRASCCPT